MFATAAIMASLVATGTATSVSVPQNGIWCAEPVTLADRRNNLKALPTGEDLSFRGQFKDFALFVEPKNGDVPSCEMFLVHHVGDDGLWVIEEPNQEVSQNFYMNLMYFFNKPYFILILSIYYCLYSYPDLYFVLPLGYGED